MENDTVVTKQIDNNGTIADEGNQTAVRKNVRFYKDIAQETMKPLSDRQAVAIGRGGRKLIPRCHHLSAEEIALHQEKCNKAGRFLSPYRGTEGQYNAILEALSLLGENKVHLSSAVYKKIEEIQSDPKTVDSSGKTAWERFINKPLRNEDTGRSAFRRFQQNCCVLQRLGGQNPYGLKLAQVGACIDIVKVSQTTPDGKAVFIEGVCLRTGIKDLVTPINESKKRKYKKSVDSMVPGPIG